MTRILICTMVYEFQKRYWWQASSVLQQVPFVDPEGKEWSADIRMDADVSKKDRFGSWNHALWKAFQPQGRFQGVWLNDWGTDERYGRRGHIRTQNLQDALDQDFDWLLFNDGDMVYHPQFFGHMLHHIHTKRSDRCLLIDEDRVLATYRDSMAFEDGYKLVGSVPYEGPVADAYEKANSVRTWPAAKHRISGAGFFQLVNLRRLRKRIEDGETGLDYYVASGYNRDHDTFKQNHITRSDRAFRMRLGGIAPMRCLPQIHLNHFRKDKEEYPTEIVH